METALTKERVMKIYIEIYDSNKKRLGFIQLPSSLYGELVQVAAKDEEEALRLVENVEEE
tara:strand:+ start:724 stop:903 length:180 start_codon:yes stop_codon:yes gene_type:complete